VTIRQVAVRTAAPAPALGPAALVALVGALGAIAAQRLRRRRR
jgi:hypothetical protein